MIFGDYQIFFQQRSIELCSKLTTSRRFCFIFASAVPHSSPMGKYFIKRLQLSVPTSWGTSPVVQLGCRTVPPPARQPCLYLPLPANLCTFSRHPVYISRQSVYFSRQFMYRGTPLHLAAPPLYFPTTDFLGRSHQSNSISLTTTFPSTKSSNILFLFSYFQLDNASLAVSF